MKLKDEFICLLDRFQARYSAPVPLLFLSGFWRSGTTWLQEVLARTTHAKTIFEPFSPLNENYRILITHLTGQSSESAIQTFFPNLQHPETANVLMPYLAMALEGHCHGRYAILLRDTITEGLRSRVIVKCVRSAISLPVIHRTFDVPVVHIRRNPCAVVASLAKTGWSWDFNKVTLRELITNRKDDFTWTCLANPEAIPKYDSRGAVSRIASYWAITERHAYHSLLEQSWAFNLEYETLVHQPQGQLDEIHKFLGLKRIGAPRFELNAKLTNKARRELSGKQRSNDWKTRLSKSDIRQVCEAVEEFFPEYRIDM